MTLRKSTGRRYSSTDLRKCLAAILLVILSATTQRTARTQQQVDASDGNTLLTAAQVVEGMVEMNLRRAQALHSYRGTRTYRVAYSAVFSAPGALRWCGCHE